MKDEEEYPVMKTAYTDYPMSYKISRLRDGMVLKFKDRSGFVFEVAMTDKEAKRIAGQMQVMTYSFSESSEGIIGEAEMAS